VLFNYLNDFYIIYLNNILIYSDNKLKYKEYVYKIFLQLCKTGLLANIKKTEFYITYIKYLSFIINIKGIKVNLEKVSIINS
jgi:hypothetical protein